LSGVLVLDQNVEAMSVSFWTNPEARHPLPAPLLASVLACFR
jgi:hypothetical protein